jgi:hypothetical protein
MELELRGSIQDGRGRTSACCDCFNRALRALSGPRARNALSAVMRDTTEGDSRGPEVPVLRHPGMPRGRQE